MEFIQVALRVRPLNLKEALLQDKNYWQISEKSSNISLFPKNVPNYYNNFRRLPAKSFYSFTYDHCFTEEATNLNLYEKSIKKIVLSSLMGINGTVFMYGQTGAGKTYTMLGSKQAETSFSSASIGRNIFHDDIKENSGVLLIALNDFFENIRQNSEKSYIVRCSYIEIYNENTYDLLSDYNNEILTIVEDVNKKEFIVKGVSEILVSSKKEITEILKRGEINRHYALTNLNHSSSRSHTIFSLKVKCITNNACSLTESHLNFVDLAGSEKLSHYQLSEEEIIERDYLSDNAISDNMSSTNFAQRLKEGQSINKSLFFLTHVISLRSEGKTFAHIPYRNSPLTKILRSSLGGNSRTLIILCITPSLTHLEQSLSTMRFGVQAKKIENKIQANIITAPNENETVKLLIEDYEKKIKELEKERLEDKEKIRNLNIDLNGKIKISKENLKKTNEVDIEFLEKTGVIFLSSDSQKKQKDIKELLPTKLKKNWQTLIFDSEGKIALEAYCKMKDLQSLFQFNQQQYQENFKDILKEHLELQEKYLILEQKKNDYKTKAKTLYLKLNLTQKELALSHSRLNLIESFIGFKKLSNKEILALEELFSKGLVQCQNERLNRVTKKGSLIKNIEEEESPRKNNRPINLPDEFMEFSEDDQNINSIDSFQELENKIQSKEETRKNKMKIEASRLQEKFAKKIKSITTKITLQKEDLKKFEQNYLDLLLKKTNEDRLAFISNELLLTKKKENIKQKPKFPRIHEPKHLNLSSSSKTEEEFKPSLNLKPPENNRQKFRSLDARETKEISKSDKKITRIKNKSKPAPKGKDFIEMNKKNLGFKLSPSNPLFEPQKKDSNNSIPLDSKIQKAYERGNIFLKEKNIEMEVKLDQMPPKTPVFDSGRIKTDDMENFSTEEEKKKLLNNPKNMLMTLLSNLNNQNQNTTKRSDNSKELTKGNVSESCAFKISNYKSILDKETMKIIEEKKKKLLSSGINKIKGFEKGNEPNESEIEKIVENESFFSNCINGFEYLLTPDLAEKKTSNPFDEIAFESDSGTTKNAITTKKSTAFKKKKK